MLCLSKLPVLLSLLCCAATCAQNKSQAVLPQDYYNFYNSILSPYRIRRVILANKPERFDASNSLFEHKGKLFDTLFAKTDSAFLEAQITQAANFFWAPGMIDNTTVINPAYARNFFNGSNTNNTHDNGVFCSYSVPLFSKNKTLCIILCSYHCGSLCGHGDVFYYRKTQAGWKVVYHYVTWIS